jgi:hypothetical protein
MSEKELLYRLTHTGLGSLLDVTTYELVSRVKPSMDIKKLHHKLTAYLVHKSNISELLNITIAGECEDITAPSLVNDYVARYESQTLTKSIINGKEVSPDGLGRFNQTLIMDVNKYLEEELDAILPSLVESYPLVFIAHLFKHPVSKKQGVREAIHDYMMKHYLAPLKEAIPNIEVEYQVGDTVVFTIDVSKLNPTERASLATGDFIAYKIETKGGK